jgi:hypothetical protein
MKMMTFNYRISLVLFLITSAVYADVSVKKLEKDAKVISGEPQYVVGSQQRNVGGDSRSSIANKQANGWKLYAEQWELTRSGESLLLLPVLKEVVTAWLQRQDEIIEIQYPGGEEGELWVQELMDWFVSLGIPSSQMLAVPGSGVDDVINFSLVK